MADAADDLEAQAPPLSSVPDPLAEIAPLNPRHSGPPRDQEWTEQGMQRSTGSRRRKPAGQGHGHAGAQSFDYGQIPQIPKAPVVPEAPEPPPAPKGPPISYRDPYVNGMSNARSFADRARDLADEGTHLPSGRTPEPNVGMKEYTPFVQAIRPEIVEAQRGEIHETMAAPAGFPQESARMPFESPSQNRSAPRSELPKAEIPQHKPDLANGSEKEPNTSAPRRTSVRGNANPQKIDWAVDHSPLQRLEVKLNDLSKEEKRARVQAAEQRARERERVRKDRENQALEDNGSRGVRERKRDSARRNSVDQRPASEITPARAQSGRRVVSDSQAPAPLQTTPRSENRASRIPRPVEAAAGVAAAGAAYGVGRALSQGHGQSQGERQRASLDSAGPRLGGESNPLTRHYDGSRPTAPADRRRSADDRGVRFHPFDESINKRKTVPSAAQANLPPHQAALYAERLNVAEEGIPAHAHLAHKGGPKYEDPPQVPAAGKARQLLGFGGETAQDQVQGKQQDGRHHLLSHLHRHQQHPAPSGPQPSRHLDEWRQGQTARLLLSDLTARRRTDSSNQNDKGMTWWESPKTSQRRGSRSSSQPPPEVEYFDGANEDTNRKFPNHLIKRKIIADKKTRRDEYEVLSASQLSNRNMKRVRIQNYSGNERLQPVSYPPISRLRSARFQKSLVMNRISGGPGEAIQSHSQNTHPSTRLTRPFVYPEPTIFDPPLYMKCGPLLRYTGLKRDKIAPPAGAPAPDRETWRGSVMIVTVDADSVYKPAPTLRLFHQPMELLPPPPTHVSEGDEALPSEYVDPIAGMPKIARDGSTVYVKPAEDFEEGADYSRIETDDGLYERMRTANVPTGYGRPDDEGGSSPLGRPEAATRRGKAKGRFREVQGVRLHAERGVTFWRFNLEVELGEKQARIAYRINKGASVGFWVPARGQSMNMMFHSCNGFSASVKPEEFGGPDPLWRDVLNAHQTKPFHVMIGGGDQIYNDRVTTETQIFQDWLDIKNPSHKREAPFTPEMRDELEQFYLDRYAMWFSQGLFGMANSQIPMVNIWDDHDIIDGYGSYPHSFMSSPVFCGLGSVAFKFYMLFQHQSVPDELEADEPSWLLGASPGPYINYLSRNIFVSLGKHVAFLGLDCRTERMREEILSEHTYDRILERCRREIVNSETKHLIVLLGVPIAYPRLEWLENILTSRAMDPLKALGRLGLLGNLTNKFDGGYEILDDLDDHWTAKHHKEERRWLIEELQDLAAEKSVRITILGGDVHLAAMGQFYSNKKLNIPKDQDHRYMPNIVSSAIVNTPPTDMMADFINRRDKKVHHLDDHTDEDMIPMFTHDVDGKRRNNKKLLPRRNWCSISEYQPGTTPPVSPSLAPSEPETPDSQWTEDQQPRRSFSLSNSRPVQMLRRLSTSNRDKDELDPSLPYSQQRPPRDDPGNDSYFPPESRDARKFNQPQRNFSAPPIPTRPVSQFHRRPTNLSEMAAKKGALPDGGGEISLEGGLDIRLNCEIKQGDPLGGTESYRLLVPALWYTGIAPMPAPERRPSVLKRLSSLKANPFAGRYKAADSYSDVSEIEHAPPAQFQPRPQAPVQQQPQPPSYPQLAAGAGIATHGIGGAGTGPTMRSNGVQAGSGPGVGTGAGAVGATGLREHPTQMGNSVSVESLSQRPRRQSLIKRLGSLKDKIPQLNRPKYSDDNYSDVSNDEYAPNDDAKYMRQGSMAHQSRPPITGSVDSVTRKPRRPSIAQRFGSIGRRLSQMGRRKDKDYYSDTGSYTGSETESESDHESDYFGSREFHRPGREHLASPPGSRGQLASPPVARGSKPVITPPVTKPRNQPQPESQIRPPRPLQPAVVHQPQKQQKQPTSQTAPGGVPTRTSSQRAPPKADEIPDPFKPRPKLAMSPPPQVQQAQVAPPPQAQYASSYGGSTDAMVSSRQPQATNTTAPRARNQRDSVPQTRDSRRSGGIYAPPQVDTAAESNDDGDEDSEEDSDLDSIDDLDSLKAAAKNRQRRSKNMAKVLGPEAKAQLASVRAPPAGNPNAPSVHGRKDMSKFFGEDDPAAEGAVRRRVTDPGAGKRNSGYGGIDAFNGSKKWWKLGK